MANASNDPLSTSVMEAKEDENKMEMNNSKFSTRPVRNRKLRKFEDFIVFGDHEPPTSSTPIKRIDSKSLPRDESPETNSNVFSPSTDLNITFNQSSLLVDDNSTSEVSYNQTANQTWAEHSPSLVASGNKRKISDTSVNTSTPVKRTRGRPRKMNSASISFNQSSDLLANPVGEDKERIMKKRVKENVQGTDSANLRLNETYSSIQEEGNSHTLNMEKRQRKSTNEGLSTQSSQMIGLKNKSGREKDVCNPEIFTNTSMLPEKRGRGRRRKDSKQINNSLKNDSISTLDESQVKDCIPLNSKVALHGGAKVDVAGELSTREIREKSQGNVKRHRGKPKRYSPTQFTDCLSKSQADDSVMQSSTCEEKESSFEDGHQSSKDEVEEQETDNSIILTASAISSKERRGRGRPPNISVTKRGRGRPRKNGITSQDLSSVDGGSFEAEANKHHLNKHQRQTSRRSQKRKFARRQSSSSEASSSDEEDDWQMPSSRGRGRGQSRGRGRGNKTSKSKAVFDDFKCVHCEMIFKCLNNYKYHLMSRHSLVYKAEEPQGADDPYFIVKRQGHVDCQQCGRRFKNPQYYRHHMIWCGRENEMFFCEICKRETKAMWLTQHNRMHTQQELKAQAEKLKGEELKQREEKEEEEQKDGTGVKTKRKAARCAMTMMNKLERGDEDSKDENCTISDAEDEDDDEEEGEDEGEDENEDTISQTKKKRSISSNKDAAFSERHKLWIETCKLMGNISPSEKLKHLHNYYNGAGQGRLFPDLSPFRDNWKFMNSREREKYVPHLKQSSVVNSVHGKSDDSETFTLTLGEHRCVQGKAFCCTGGPIWAMDWCPRPVACSHEQILAIASDIHPGHHLYVNTVAEGSNLLQFWSVRVDTESTEISPKLDFCIAHDSGYVRSFSWCPQGCYDEIDSYERGSSFSQNNIPSTLPRLGLLAMACSDATISIFSIPHPSSIVSSIPSTSDHHKPIIAKPKPCLKLIPNTMSDATPCLSVSWQSNNGCERIIGGYGRGEVLMWSLACRSAMAQTDIKAIRPIRAFMRHKCPVVSCAWFPSLPDFLVSCDNSGFIYVWNSNRPRNPECVLKKGSNLTTKSICMAGPVHWGFFTACDKTCIPDLHCSNTDTYHVNFFGFSPQCPVSLDFSTKVLMHYLCTWDVTFDPVFNVLVTCDAAGNVRVALLNMESLLTTLRKNAYSFSSKTLQTVLYKLSVSPELKNFKEKSSSIATSDGKEANTAQQSEQVNNLEKCPEGENSVPLHECETVSEEKADENKGTESRSLTNETSSTNEKALNDVILHYQDSKVNKAELVKPEAPKEKKRLQHKGFERENFRGSHMESIQRVRLCPGMDTNLWLASGGNAGILRFDRLHDLVIRFSKNIEKEVNLLKQSTKAANS